MIGVINVFGGGGEGGGGGRWVDGRFGANTNANANALGGKWVDRYFEIIRSK